MATTINEQQKYGLGQTTVNHFKATAGAADVTIVLNLPVGTKVLGILAPVKTTGTQAGVGAAYVESTGVLTIGPVANNDVIEVGVITP